MLLHRPGPTDGLVSAEKHHTVKTLDHTLDVLRISVHQRLSFSYPFSTQKPALFHLPFGSGFAGLGRIIQMQNTKIQMPNNL